MNNKELVIKLNWTRIYLSERWECFILLLQKYQHAHETCKKRKSSISSRDFLPVKSTTIACKKKIECSRCLFYDYKYILYVLYTCIYSWVSVFIYIYIYMFIYTNTRIYICIHINICIYIYIMYACIYHWSYGTCTRWNILPKVFLRKHFLNASRLTAFSIPGNWLNGRVWLVGLCHVPSLGQWEGAFSDEMIATQTGKSYIADRETGVSWHNGGPIEDPS